MFNRRLKKQITELMELIVSLQNENRRLKMDLYYGGYGGIYGNPAAIRRQAAEIATLKYQLANPSFGSTETAVVQEKKRHALK